MPFTINDFSGSNPRLADHLIRPGAAVRALDCKLESGNLDSWREPLEVFQASPDTTTMYRHGCCWLEFDACADVARGPVTCPDLFVTGLRSYPVRLTVADDCSLTEQRLGLPCPEVRPSILVGAPGGSVDKDLGGRSYAYQYVNVRGEKSSLSPGSYAENVRDGQSVVVSGWTPPDASWGVTSVKIYRTVSGHQSGREAGNAPDTTWMLVGEVPIAVASFTDSQYSEELMSALEEDVAPPPPSNLKGMVWIESMNVLAGFVGNRVYFSRNNKYHEWPHYLDLDDTVLGLVENNGIIYVATKGRPYVIEAAADCDQADCRKAIRLPGEFPMMGAGNRRMSAVPEGAVYPSKTGLVMLSARSLPTLLTWPLYSPEDWEALHPYSVTPVMHGGKLFVFARGANSFVMTVAHSPEDGWTRDAHSELSDTDVIDAFTNAGELYLLKDTPEGRTLYQWHRGETLREHVWVSHEHINRVPTPYGAGQLHFKHGPETVTLTADGRTILDRPVTASRVFRLPSWAEGERWTLTLRGTGLVSRFSIAASMSDLGR